MLSGGCSHFNYSVPLSFIALAHKTSMCTEEKDPPEHLLSTYRGTDREREGDETRDPLLHNPTRCVYSGRFLLVVLGDNMINSLSVLPLPCASVNHPTRTHSPWKLSPANKGATQSLLFNVLNSQMGLKSSFNCCVRCVCTKQIWLHNPAFLSLPRITHNNNNTPRMSSRSAVAAASC